MINLDGCYKEKIMVTWPRAYIVIATWTRCVVQAFLDVLIPVSRFHVCLFLCLFLHSHYFSFILALYYFPLGPFCF